MKHRIQGREAILCLALILMIHDQVYGETFQLKSGKVIEGRAVEKSPEYIKVDSHGQLIKIPVKMLADPDMIKTLAVDNASKEQALNIAEFKKVNHCTEVSFQDHLSSYHALRSGNLSEAISQARLALAKEPKCANNYFALGAAYNKAGLVQEAIEVHKRALSAVPDSELTGIFYYIIVDQLVVQGEVDEAIHYAEEGISRVDVIKDRPLQETLYFCLALIFKQKGDLTKAREYAEKSLSLSKAMQYETGIQEVEKFLKDIESKP